MKRSTAARTLGGSIAAAALPAGSVAGAQAYDPTGGTMYRLGGEPCLKGRGNPIPAHITDECQDEHHRARATEQHL